MSLSSPGHISALSPVNAVALMTLLVAGPLLVGLAYGVHPVFVVATIIALPFSIPVITIGTVSLITIVVRRYRRRRRI